MEKIRPDRGGFLGCRGGSVIHPLNGQGRAYRATRLSPYGLPSSDGCDTHTVGVDRFDRPAEGVWMESRLRLLRSEIPFRGGFTAGPLCGPLVNPYENNPLQIQIERSALFP